MLGVSKSEYEIKKVYAKSFYWDNYTDMVYEVAYQVSKFGEKTL